MLGRKAVTPVTHIRLVSKAGCSYVSQEREFLVNGRSTNSLPLPLPLQDKYNYSTFHVT